MKKILLMLLMLTQVSFAGPEILDDLHMKYDFDDVTFKLSQDPLDATKIEMGEDLIFWTFKASAPTFHALLYRQIGSQEWHWVEGSYFWLWAWYYYLSSEMGDGNFEVVGLTWQAGAGVALTNSSYVYTQSLSLAWDKNAEPSVIGYRVWWRAENEEYDINRTIEVLSDTMMSLVEGEGFMIPRKRYIALSAFTETDESDLSEEIFYE